MTTVKESQFDFDGMLDDFFIIKLGGVKWKMKYLTVDELAEQKQISVDQDEMKKLSVKEQGSKIKEARMSELEFYSSFATPAEKKDSGKKLIDFVKNESFRKQTMFIKAITSEIVGTEVK